MSRRPSSRWLEKHGLWLDAGTLDYPAACRLQHELVAQRQCGVIPDTMVVVEHPPCVTLGRGTRPESLLASEVVFAREGIELFYSDRGGDATYHGPGQVVFYPILDLQGHGRDVHQHARRLEEVMIQTAAAFGVTSWRRPGLPGVWTSGGKLGALGIAVRRWISFHGAALNVSPDLAHFDLIVPCGIDGCRATSLERLLGVPVDADAVRRELRECCERVFELELSDAAFEDMTSSLAAS